MILPLAPSSSVLADFREKTRFFYKFKGLKKRSAHFFQIFAFFGNFLDIILVCKEAGELLDIQTRPTGQET